MKSIVFTLITLLGLASCSSDSSRTEDYPMISIELSSLIGKNLFLDDDGNLKKYRLLESETNDKYLIKWIEKIIIDENFIFIKDANKKLFVFDGMTGKFLNSIGQIGAAPNELLTFVDFYVDKRKKTVHIYDLSRSKMLEYSYKGDVLNIVDCDSRSLSDFTAFSYIQDSDLILTMFNSTSSKNNYRIIDAKKYALKEDCLPFCVTGSQNVIFNDSKVAISGKECYAVTRLSDTIYQYSTDTLFYPKYLFDGGLKHINNEIIEKNRSLDLAMEANPSLRKEGIPQLHIIGDYLYFPYYKEGSEYKILWNRKNQKGYYMKDFYCKDAIKGMGNLITTTDNALVCVIQLNKLIETCDMADYDDLNTRNVLNSTTEEDNLILAFYYIDQFYCKRWVTVSGDTYRRR